MAKLQKCDLTHVLEVVPNADWRRNWKVCANMTIMFLKTSKRMRRLVIFMRLPVVLRANRVFWESCHNGTAKTKIHGMLNNLNNFAKNTSIYHLELNDCFLKTKIHRLSKILQCCEYIEYLNLSNNSLDELDEKEFSYLIEALKKCKSLKHLYLSCTFRKSMLNILKEMLTVITNIESLDLSIGQISEALDDLRPLNNLVNLNLNNNHLGKEAKKIPSILLNFTALCVLKLRHNEINDEHASQFSKLTGLTSLTNIDLSDNNISGIVAASISFENLIHLNLNKNQIGSIGTEDFGKALGQCIQIRSLELSTNQIDKNGIMNIARGLQHLTNLTCLNLMENQIGPEGSKSFFGIFGLLPKLSNLQLSSNNLGTKGIEILASILGQCTSLVLLKISNNQIGHDGFVSLSGVLGFHTSLKTLDIRYNQCSYDSANIITKAQMRCPSLKHINHEY
jgi:Leucine-rich repeat (LRR) protein